MLSNNGPAFPLISIVIPARNEESNIGNVVRLVIRQCPERAELEVIVVDDGSNDRTVIEAEKAGATVLCLNKVGNGGNPAIARNRGAAVSHGDPIVFLDSDCIPRDTWLETLLAVHCTGVEVVGGSLALPVSLSFTARCDYYCGWYHHHPERPAGLVAHHPPCNLSVRRAAFMSTGGFFEHHPVAYAHEELAWQAALQARGGKIYFEPKAVVDHHNRPRFGNMLRRNYRWGYSSLEAKAESGITRCSLVYRYPYLVIAASVPLAPVTTIYLIACWLRARVLEPLWMLPMVLAARVAYSVGMAVGGVRWLSRRGTASVQRRPRWE